MANGWKILAFSRRVFERCNSRKFGDIFKCVPRSVYVAGRNRPKKTWMGLPTEQKRFSFSLLDMCSCSMRWIKIFCDWEEEFRISSLCDPIWTKEVASSMELSEQFFWQAQRSKCKVLFLSWKKILDRRERESVEIRRFLINFHVYSHLFSKKHCSFADIVLSFVDFFIGRSCVMKDEKNIMFISSLKDSIRGTYTNNLFGI